MEITWRFDSPDAIQDVAASSQSCRGQIPPPPQALTLFHTSSGMTLSHERGPLWPGWILTNLKPSVGILEPKIDSLPFFRSLAVHRHQKQHFMNCSFGHAGCWKAVAKNEILYEKIGQNLKFLDTWELYTSKECLEHVQCKFKKKKYDSLKKR